MNVVKLRSPDHAFAFFNILTGSRDRVVLGGLIAAAIHMDFIVTCNLREGSCRVTISDEDGARLLEINDTNPIENFLEHGFRFNPIIGIDQFFGMSRMNLDGTRGVGRIGEVAMGNLIRTGFFRLNVYYMLKKDYLDLKKGTLIKASQHGEALVRYKKEIYDLTENKNIVENVRPEDIEQLLKTNPVHEA